MPGAGWIALVLLAGATLIFGAIRATASVGKGSDFVKWMIVVSVAFITLASIPILAGVK
jgi:hypothetical protein